MKKILLLIIFLNSQKSFGQKPGIDWFVRLPHVVNVDFKTNSTRYTPVVSTGVTFHCGKVFSDFGIFINEKNFYGYYSYFGSPVYEKKLDDHWKWVTNWFGEATFVQSQPEMNSSWTYTVGVSPVFVRPLSWSTFGIALTVGAGLTDKAVSLNTRLILNCSIPFTKK